MHKDSATHSNLVLQDVDQDFSYWADRKFLSEAHRDSVRQADLLIVPRSGFRGYEQPCFAHNTIELFHDLKEKMRNHKIEICCEDAEYRELGLFSELWDIGEFVAKSVIVPVLVVLLKDYIEKRLKMSRDRKLDVTFAVTIVEGKNRKQIKFNGPAASFEKLIDKGLRDIQPEYSAQLMDDRK